MNYQGRGVLVERVISSEERIRRAEEIYNRRRSQNGVRVSSTNVNSNKKVYENSSFKKLILQILISLIIYFIFYLIKNSNYIFSEDVLNKTREFLSYDINFQEAYTQVEGYYNDNIKSFFDNLNNSENNSNEEQNQENNEGQNQENNEENIENNEENNIDEQSGIGGGEDVISNNGEVTTSADEVEPVEEVHQLSQMEIDANEIKANYNFILPLKGTVTSRYGPRTATEIISPDHKGIDIGVNEGTVFVAAMEGTAILVSGEGTYGNHIYIQNGDVTTVYAHCKTIYIKQGDYVSQGQQVGEVGATGNATGPHLHFEVRKSDRYVNPEYILSF